MNYLTGNYKKVLDKMDPVSDYTNYRYHQVIWDIFWKRDYRGKKNDNILDYGCGPCWSVFTGSNLGFKNIIPLEICTERDAPKGSHFKNFYRLFEVHPTFWDGKIMSFDDDFFDSIVAKASILKLTNTKFESMINELCRVTKKGSLWHIAPMYQYDRFLNKLREKNMKQILAERSIKLCPWTVRQKSKSLCILEKQMKEKYL